MYNIQEIFFYVTGCNRSFGTHERKLNERYDSVDLKICQYLCLSYRNNMLKISHAYVTYEKSLFTNIQKQ